MTTCPDCMTAAVRAWHAFESGCMVCQARRISRRLACFEAERAGYITPAYRAELEGVAGEAHWQTVHALVRAWRRGDCPEMPTLSTDVTP